MPNNASVERPTDANRSTGVSQEHSEQKQAVAAQTFPKSPTARVHRDGRRAVGGVGCSSGGDVVLGVLSESEA